MSSKNTITIERNPYTGEVKYFWKNEAGKPDDLSEVMGSPFFRGKRDYGEFSVAILADPNMARRIVETIDNGYNGQKGLQIEVNGVESDYLAVRNAMEESFSGRGMECIWGRRMRTSVEAAAQIKNIYAGLARMWSECGGEDTAELCDRNDGNGWLRYGFDRDGVTGETALYVKCGQAGDYLQTIIEDIKRETGKNLEELRTLKEKAGEQREPKKADRKEPEKSGELKKSIRRLCERQKRELRREFARTLEKSFVEPYTDRERIAGLVKEGVWYADQHPEEWKREPSEKDIMRQYLIDMTDRREYINKRIVDCFNEDMKKYDADTDQACAAFWEKGIADFEEELCEEIWKSRKFSIRQKEMVRAFVRSCDGGEFSQSRAAVAERVETGQFRWTEKALDEKEISREYRNKLGRELESKNKAILDESEEAFDRWAAVFDSMPENGEPQTANAAGQTEDAEAAFLEERREKLVRLLDTFQESKNKIEAMISFR